MQRLLSAITVVVVLLLQLPENGAAAPRGRSRRSWEGTHSSRSTRKSGPCDGLPSYSALKEALTAARKESNGGFNLDMWGTVVNRDGVVCAVVFTGASRGDQWPGSRVISAQKANTANAFSLPSLAISTANLYSSTQPGGSLFGLAHSNPVDTGVAYGGDPQSYGQERDFMVGKRVGGINVFGGGLPLYDRAHTLVGGLGVSGDSSCADHNVAWRTRHALNLDFVPKGVTGNTSYPDNIVYDISNIAGVFTSSSGWGHPACSETVKSISDALPSVQPVAPPKQAQPDEHAQHPEQADPEHQTP